MDYLKSIVTLWMKQFTQCRKTKQRQFGKTANRLWDFMGKSYRQLYLERSGDDPDFTFPTPDQKGPYYKPRINKTREFISVVLPFVHAKIPHRLVTPRRPPLPPELVELSQLAEGDAQASSEDRIRAWMLQWWLNYLPGEYGAKREQRMAICEGLVKGRGLCWHELTPGPLGMIPASFADTVDYLLIDPDSRSWREAAYIVRERHWPAWKLAETFQIPVERIRAARKKGSEEDEPETNSEVAAAEETTQSDLCKWYEVWSRIGMGQRLYGAEKEFSNQQEALEAHGRHVWLAIMPGLDYPLNLPPEIWEVATQDEFHDRLQWPIAFFEEPANPFPCTPLDIYPNGDNPWATSPLEGALPLQVFLDHLYAFLMTRVRITSRDIIITAKALEDKLRKAILSGLDQVVVSVEGLPGDEIKKLVEILQFPPVNADGWRVVAQVERAYEQATGMDPLLYGSEGSRQIRSAEEAGVRQTHVTNRPNDYADAVEEWNSQVAAKEAQMTRLYVRPEQVAPLFREPVPEPPENAEAPPDGNGYGPLTLLWSSLVNTDDPAEAVADLHYTVEAGSGRRKNRQKQMSDLQAIGQVFLPVLQQFAVSGLVDPFNAFVDIVSEAYEMPLGRIKLPAVNLQPPEEEPQETEASK